MEKGLLLLLHASKPLFLLLLLRRRSFVRSSSDGVTAKLKAWRGRKERGGKERKTEKGETIALPNGKKGGKYGHNSPPFGRENKYRNRERSCERLCLSQHPSTYDRQTDRRWMTQNSNSNSNSSNSSSNTCGDVGAGKP